MKYVIANWKQNKTFDEAVLWCGEFVRLMRSIDLENVIPIICPPVPFLESIRQSLLGVTVALGVQDVSPFADGAHTGFVGINQVKQSCKYALVGHSERQESRDLVMQKVKQCLSVDIVPVVCFKSPNDYKIIDGAIYVLEDPDNISVGGVYRSKNIQEVENSVDTARKFFGPKPGIIYGGSVNGENAQDLALIKGLDGVLVGNASLNPADFIDIVRKFSL
ncbi:MAG: triose-phosphate isomerase family protein [Patescibacteria group bacterium]